MRERIVILIQVECETDTDEQNVRDDIVRILETMLPYMTDNVIVKSHTY